MNRTLRATLAMMGTLYAGAAAAQSNVTIYGIVDSGVVYTTNTTADGKSMLKMPTLTGSLPSRLGFRGNEDLGGGLHAVFALESGFGMDTGMSGQGNRLFGRQAFVGIKGALGTISLGRQINMTTHALMKTNLMGPNLFSVASFDPYLANAISDNAIAYFHSGGGYSGGVTYSTGRDVSTAGGPAGTACPGEVAGNSKACRQVTGLFSYDSKAFGLAASYDILYGNTGAAFGLTSAANSDRRIIVGGYWMAGETRIAGGLLARTTRAATGLTESDMFYIGASHPLSTALVLDAQFIDRKNKHSNVRTSALVARLSYALSKRTTVYGSVARSNNSATAAVPIDVGGTVGVGKSQLGVLAGVRHGF